MLDDIAEGCCLAASLVRVELVYNMAAWLDVMIAVGLPLGSVVEGNLMEIVWFARQKGTSELWDIAQGTVLMGLVLGNLL